MEDAVSTRVLIFLLLIIFLFPPLLISSFGSAEMEENSETIPPIYISFLWHMHQPIYEPYENVVATMASDSGIRDIFDSRTGPYTSWPADAVGAGKDAGLEHLGAQVSFSGSLIENLNNIQAAGECYGHFSNWKAPYSEARSRTTSLGNPRLDMVGFGYHHPLMGLIDEADMKKQIQAHKKVVLDNFGGDVAYSKGIFPPENAFSERMIPTLVDEGFEWALVDNVHFERACKDYPWSSGGNLYEPNPSDQVNKDPMDWVQLNNIWAPTKVSAQWAHQPHYAQFEDADGETDRMVVVPASRYLGNEDGRGGFGALQYEQVLSQLEAYNNDPRHPILVVLAHDGDNYGGGSESYYHSNFQNFISWCLQNPDRFVPTTIQDYLDMFPPDPEDIIHVEDGSWSGADNGDPEFLKWNGDPDDGDYSPDRNSWAVVTAAKNRVLTAEDLDPGSTDTKEAWKHLMNAETSCYWYWDGTADWDDKPTRACNNAMYYADRVIDGEIDNTPPTIYLPQRNPYNPGFSEWGQPMGKDIEVWTLAYDLSGLDSVELVYRVDEGSWSTMDMHGSDTSPKTSIQPLYISKEYRGTIVSVDPGQSLIEYYVRSADTKGNIGRSPLMRVGKGDSWWKPSPIHFSDIFRGEISSSKDLEISVDVTSDRGSITDVNLKYSINSGSEKSISMHRSERAVFTWKTAIPALEINPGDEVFYWIVARDDQTNQAFSSKEFLSFPHPIVYHTIYNSDPHPGESLDVWVEVSSSGGLISKCDLVYTINGQQELTIPFSKEDPSGSILEWKASIPLEQIVSDTYIEYWIAAFDDLGDQRISPRKSLAVGGSFFTPELDGANDFPEPSHKYEDSEAMDQDISGLWLCNDDEFFYMGLALGADPKSDAEEDFVGVYFSDGSQPSTTNLRYGEDVGHETGLELGWWDANDYYCQHIFLHGSWNWMSNHREDMAYGPNQAFLEIRIRRDDNNHLYWGHGKTIKIYVNTAREGGGDLFVFFTDNQGKVLSPLQFI